MQLPSQTPLVASGEDDPLLDPDDVLASYDYELPRELVAAVPGTERDGSRLLVLDRRTAATGHTHFRDLARCLAAGDLLVLNDTRVLPARLRARRSTGGSVEVLLLPEMQGATESPCMHALLRPAARVRAGETLEVSPGLKLTVEDPPGCELRTVRLHGPLSAFLGHGQMPLPPYLPRPRGEEPLDRERYQTVYARHPGAVAAPTAGLHFTPRLLTELEGRGIAFCTITLHVGPGTFFPVRTERLSEHSMHAESYTIPTATAATIAAARRRGGRIVAVGTTTTRALEAASAGRDLPAAGPGRTHLLIRPPFEFRCVDALVTNFHLPRSTLLALVSAFAGRERVLATYREAVQHGYRFYSYGDAMLIL